MSAAAVIADELRVALLESCVELTLVCKSRAELTVNGVEIAWSGVSAACAWLARSFIVD